MKKHNAPRFVVYHIASTMEKKSFYFEHHAQDLARKLNAQAAIAASDPERPDQYAVATIDHYNRNVVHLVTRVNLRSGMEYQEPSNTPGYCSPASEAYWAM